MQWPFAPSHYLSGITNHLRSLGTQLSFMSLYSMHFILDLPTALGQTSLSTFSLGIFFSSLKTLAV